MILAENNSFGPELYLDCVANSTKAPKALREKMAGALKTLVVLLLDLSECAHVGNDVASAPPESQGPSFRFLPSTQTTLTL